MDNSRKTTEEFLERIKVITSDKNIPHDKQSSEERQKQYEETLEMFKKTVPPRSNKQVQKSKPNITEKTNREQIYDAMNAVAKKTEENER